MTSVFMSESNSKYMNVHNWVVERTRQTFEDEPVIDRKIVVIRRKSDITLDIINNPDKYILVWCLPRCSFCGSMEHNSRRHK
jgi:hypothetical protein